MIRTHDIRLNGYYFMGTLVLWQILLSNTHLTSIIELTERSLPIHSISFTISWPMPLWKRWERRKTKSPKTPSKKRSKWRRVVRRLRKWSKISGNKWKRFSNCYLCEPTRLSERVQIVLAKQQFRLNAKHQEAMTTHLGKVIETTEKYTEWLTEDLKSNSFNDQVELVKDPDFIVITLISILSIVTCVLLLDILMVCGQFIWRTALDIE